MMVKTMHDLGLKTSIQTFDAFVRCTLMGNQLVLSFTMEFGKGKLYQTLMLSRLSLLVFGWIQ